MKNIVLLFCCALALVGCSRKVGAPVEIRPSVYTVDIERMQTSLSGAQMDAKVRRNPDRKRFLCPERQANIYPKRGNPTHARRSNGLSCF